MAVRSLQTQHVQLLFVWIIYYGLFGCLDIWTLPMDAAYHVIIRDYEGIFNLLVSIMKNSLIHCLDLNHLTVNTSMRAIYVSFGQPSHMILTVIFHIIVFD